MKTVLNLSPVPEAPVGLLDYVDYVAVNEVESAQLIGVDRWDQIPLDDLIQRVYEKLGCGCVLITLGADGCAGKKAIISGRSPERTWKQLILSVLGMVSCPLLP